MKVYMLPQLSEAIGEESGIKRVIEAYNKYLPLAGIEMVKDEEQADIVTAHIDGARLRRLDVLHCHGLYWTQDYPGEAWQYQVNANVIASARKARVITVPSAWVAEPFQRDMRINPAIIGHGIVWEEWQDKPEREGYVLWNKNRHMDVCDPRPVEELVKRRKAQKYITTFYPTGARPGNLTVTGVMPHDEMRRMITRAGVYLATTKETGGIGILEAMASGVPVLGFNWGAVVDLVQHGVNGYLARAGDWDDLARGLDYCQEHNRVLGENGRELAKAYTWEAVARKLVALYSGLLEREPPDVTVVIPCHNYGTEDKLGRAIQSAIGQTRPPAAIIAVDDGSSDRDGVARLVENYRRGFTGLVLLRQDRQGVAVARNAGIAVARTRYVCCLDADDAIEPQFLEACVGELEADAALGIAYTRLKWITADGKMGVSEWPNDCDPDAQMAGRNQVPTCSVFRREMWERLGGFKKRYCPGGAGEEDAEFYLRSMAHGWAARRAGEEPLFIYSWKSGQVSGNRQHRETNWLMWHPWTRDDKPPFASVTKPRRASHPVRQYDEPEVSVVIPVGPGHEAKLEDALDSLEAQTFRKWEAVVVWDNADWEGETVHRIQKAYPYIRWVHNKGVKGSGYSRNRGVEIARAPLILFLDADDYLAPEALDKMVAEFRLCGHAIYTDYVGLAYVDDPGALSPDLDIKHREEDGWTAIGYKAAEYDCVRAQAQPEQGKPYTWNLVTTLFPKAWHEEIGGFDEVMTTWEDVDYWWRMAQRGKCFRHIHEELVIYRFYTGHRREKGVLFQKDGQAYQDAMAYLRGKYAQQEMVMCSSCPQGIKSVPPPIPPAMRMPALAPAGQTVVASDADFVLCLYNSANRGQMRVIGGAGFQFPQAGVPMVRVRELFHFDYGYRGGGEKFIVHREDIKAQPELFIPLPEVKSAPVPETLAPVPVPLGTQMVKAASEDGPGAPMPASPAVVPAPPEPLVPFLEKDIEEVDLPGLGPEVKKALVAAGHKTPKALLAIDLTEFPGIGKRKAKLVVDYIEKRSG